MSSKSGDVYIPFHQGHSRMVLLVGGKEMVGCVGGLGRQGRLFGIQRRGAKELR